MRERDTERWRRPPYCNGARGTGSRAGRDLLGSKLLGEPSSSRFRGDVITQKGREAVGDGYRIKRGSRWYSCTTSRWDEWCPRTRLSGFYRKGSAMTQVACSSCRLRFTAAASAYLLACPQCGRPLHAITDAEGVVGFRLFVVEDVPRDLPQAVALSIPIPDPGAGRS